MARVKHILHRAYALFSSHAIEREIDDELLFHLEMRTEENIDSGMTPSTARQEAVRRFGDLAQIRAACRQVEIDNHPGLKALKLLLWVVVGIGLSLRLSASVRGVKPLGDLLVIIAMFSRLLIYVRSTRADKYTPSRSR
jgi:hypothetical protein